VGDTVPVHDLGATKLQVGSVDFATEQLVDGLRASKDNWLAFNLNGALTEADKVSTDTCWLSVGVYKDLKTNTYQLNGR
jgi:hypothetical protein